MRGCPRLPGASRRVQGSYSGLLLAHTERLVRHRRPVAGAQASTSGQDETHSRARGVQLVVGSPRVGGASGGQRRDAWRRWARSMNLAGADKIVGLHHSSHDPPGQEARTPDRSVRAASDAGVRCFWFATNSALALNGDQVAVLESISHEERCVHPRAGPLRRVRATSGPLGGPVRRDLLGSVDGEKAPGS